MASNTSQAEKTLGEQMADLLRRKPKNFDVVFSVGPDKIKVRAVKFILKAASPVFEREFDENWENILVTDDRGIPLPNLDPTAFLRFVNLLMLDAWSVDFIKSLNLSPNNLLDLLGLCRRYEITKAIENLEVAVEDFIQSFDKFKDTAQFLEISRDNLETIFSSEKLPVGESEIFDCACRWANNRCAIKGLEPTGENYCEVLGACVFQIRFPTMSTDEFSTVCDSKENVLKGFEQLAISLIVRLNKDRKTIKHDKIQLEPETNPKVESVPSLASDCSFLTLPLQYKSTTSPSFVCNGRLRGKLFQVNEKISVHGFGFLGPIDGDGSFDVTVQVLRMEKHRYTFDSGTFRKNIFAQKGKIFHFLLDEPITLEPITIDGSSENCYNILLSILGPNNISQYKAENPRPEIFEVSGIQFRLYSNWNRENPLAELLFKKI